MSEQKGKKQGWLGRLIGKKQAETPPPESVAPPPIQVHPAIAELAEVNAAAVERANFSPMETNVGTSATETPVSVAATEIFDKVGGDVAVVSTEPSEAKSDKREIPISQEDAPRAEIEPAAIEETPPEEEPAASPPVAEEPAVEEPIAEASIVEEPPTEQAPPAKLAAHLLAFGGETLEDDQTPTSEKTGWFARIRKGLSRSSHKISDGIADFMIRQKLDDEALDEMEDLLITSDLGVKTAARMSKKLSRHRFAANVNATLIKEELAEEIAAILSPFAAPLIVDRTKKPHVILVVGVNGSGKTTTIGKLAKYYRDHDLSVSLVAGDTFRAAAVEQLKVWGERAGCPVVSGMAGADPAGLAFDALAAAKKRGDDLVLIDTAGRLQNKTDLMAELDKIVRVIKKQDPTLPHDVLLVLDATVGQNAHSQVEHFKDITNVTGLIVTKLDGTARGGVVVALAERFGLPIHAIGIGEGADDLRPFRAKDFARSLVGLED